MKDQRQITVGFVALGCPKNIIDSESMLARIGQGGFILSNDIDNADIVVINTCGFIKPARDEAIDAITQAVDAKNKGTVKKVIVAGCLAQRMGKELLNEVKGIDAVVGLGQRDDIAKIIRRTLKASHKHRKTLFMREKPLSTSDDTGRLLITHPHSAYLRISEGCNRRCSFCTIPNIRGPFRSKPRQKIISEARELAQNGAVELSIIAQDSNFYGRDLKIKDGLANLIRDLEDIDTLLWIRLMYLYPANIDENLIETIANSKKALNYIDMPVQHINNDILKAMKRTDTEEKTTALIEKLRSAMPDVVLRTTIIVGFPGETDAQFDQLLDFVRWAKFDALGCFTFYPEEGTPAAKLPDQISEDIKQQRFRELMLAQQEIAFEKADQLIGKEINILVDEFSAPDGDDPAVGRYFGQAPEIDSICYINSCSAAPGEFINAKITKRTDYDLVAKQI